MFDLSVISDLYESVYGSVSNFCSELDPNWIVESFENVYEYCWQLWSPPNTSTAIWDTWMSYLEATPPIINALTYFGIGYLVIGILTYLFFKKKPFIPRNRVLIITAHLSDECMILGPTILRLKATSKVHLLCLTRGDLDQVHGRRNYFVDSCESLGIPVEQVTLMNVSRLFTIRAASRVILDMIISKAIGEVYTYDDKGVNGDIDRVSVYYGLATMCLNNEMPRYCKVYALESVNQIRKFSSCFDTALSYLTNTCVFVAGIYDQRILWNAVRKYKPEMPWFWHLYRLYSRYTFVNTYKVVEPGNIRF